MHGLPPSPPAPEGDEGPDRFDHAKRPRALQETVNRAQDTGDGKTQHEPGAALFQRVADHHCGNRKQAESAKECHIESTSSGANPVVLVSMRIADRIDSPPRLEYDGTIRPGPSRNEDRRNVMEWTAPAFEEICLNCEINSYASATL